MSLIIDALKKAEKDHLGDGPAGPPLVPSGGPPKPPEESRSSGSLTYGVAVLFVLLLAGIAFFLWRHVGVEKRDASSPPPPSAIRSIQATAIPVRPTPPVSRVKDPEPTPSPRPEPILPPTAVPTSLSEEEDQDHWLNEMSRRAIEKWRQDQEAEKKQAEQARTLPATPPPQPASPPTKALKLQLIVWDEENPSAVINGRIVHQGDDVDGARVTEISRSHVILDVNGQSVTLRF